MKECPRCGSEIRKIVGKLITRWECDYCNYEKVEKNEVHSQTF